MTAHSQRCTPFRKGHPSSGGFFASVRVHAAIGESVAVCGQPSKSVEAVKGNGSKLLIFPPERKKFSSILWMEGVYCL